MNSATALIKKYLTLKANAKDLKDLFKIFKSNSERELKQILDEEMSNIPSDQIQYLSDEQMDSILGKIHQRIQLENQQGQKRAWVRRLYSPLGKAAAVLILASSASLYYYWKSAQIPALEPGTFKASLISRNRVIDLSSDSKGTIATENGVNIKKVGKGLLYYEMKQKETGSGAAIHQLTAPNGGQYKLRLCDGTIIVLNAGSSIEFPIAFRDTVRKVKLKGEAYFEVAKNKQQPFIVQVDNMNIRVLGTKFNVSSFPEEKGIKTTLLEGSVLLTNKNTQKQALLKPNEQATGTSADLAVKTVNASEYAEWTNDKFVFNNEPLANVMHKLARWYNFEMDYNSLPDKYIYLNISRQTEFKDLLNMISSTTDVQFKWQSNRLTVDN